MKPGERKTYRSRPWKRLRPGRRFFVALTVLVVILVGANVALRVTREAEEPGPREAMASFLADWSRGDDPAAARATDDPARAARVLAANRRGLDGATVRASLVGLREDPGGGTARARLRLAWDVPELGPWTYETDARLRDGEDGWQLVWRPSMIHPFVDGIARLGTTRDPARRGRIEDRRGRPIVTLRAVTRVGLEAGEAGDPARAAAALGRVVPIDEDAYAERLRASGPDQFVEALLLRRAEFREKRAALRAIEGFTAVEDRAPLAPSRDFARALLGVVGPATEEDLERLGDRAEAGDLVGQTGLQRALEPRLAGTPGRRIVLRVDGSARDTLMRAGGEPGERVRTTLDVRVQRAAQSALSGARGAAALVAIKPSNGDVLAVASEPGGSAFNRALEGRYPPGSTFKVVSTAALLRDGLRPSDPVACPRTITVGGRPFRNFEGSAGGTVPFAQDFAQSCNTAFASLADRLGANDLRETARDYGLGEPLKLPVPSPRAAVPRVETPDTRAAAMIGQDRIQTSPLSMAGVAGTVAEGRWHAPRLLASDDRRAGRRIPAAERDALRSLMRRVVTSGTGQALAGLPGTVLGKSGTAEFGNANPPQTRAWFIAARGDLALAVLVERGRSGGAVAAPIAARFLRSVPPG